MKQNADTIHTLQNRLDKLRARLTEQRAVLEQVELSIACSIDRINDVKRQAHEMGGELK